MASLGRHGVEQVAKPQGEKRYHQGVVENNIKRVSKEAAATVTSLLLRTTVGLPVQNARSFSSSIYDDDSDTDMSE